MLSEFDASANNSYLGAVSATPVWPGDPKDPAARGYNTPRSSYRYGQSGCNTSAINGNSTNVNGTSSRLHHTNNTSSILPSSSLIRTADGRVFRPVAMLRSDEQRSSGEQATFAGAAPSNDQLSLREIELHLSQRPSARRYLRQGSRNQPAAFFDGLQGRSAGSATGLRTAISGR